MAGSGTRGRAGSENGSTEERQLTSQSPQPALTLPSPWIPGSQLPEPSCASVSPVQWSSLGARLTRFISVPHNLCSLAIPALGPVASLSRTETHCPSSHCPILLTTVRSKVLT